MIVEQAIFGEVKAGHALKAASGDPAVAADLASRLDLPDTAPPGVSWSPFISGFPHRDYFVVARTFHDVRATRAGMVLSHALIAPIDDVIDAPDIRPLFNRLIVEANAPSDLVTLDINLGDEVPAAATDLHATAVALSTRAPGPVVRLGVNGFDDLVVSLWGTMWPAMRRRFSFRLSFGPADLVEKPQPVLVCTPPGVVARWRGYRLVEVSDSLPSSLSASMLSGHKEGEALGSFADRIGAKDASFGDLPMLEEAYRLIVLEPDKFGNVVAAVRLVEHLSPTATRGANAKTELLNRLVVHLQSATAAEVRLLRNLVLQGFGQVERLWSALASWAAKNTFPEAQDNSCISVIVDATEVLKSTNDWRNAVLSGLSEAARASGTSFATAFWRWAEADPAIIRPLWKIVETTVEIEDRLVKAAPRRLKREAAQQILEHSREARLYRLHGAAAAAAYSPSDAVRLQVEVEPVQESAGLRVTLRSATPQEVVACAVEIADPRAIQLAAEQVTKTPTLLRAVDLSAEAGRSVWAASLARDLDAWSGPANPRSAFDAILLDLLDGRLVTSELIELLSRTPLADLTGFARRTELWSRLTGTTRDALIRATARGWLAKAAANASVSEPETEIQSAIVSDRKLYELLDQFADGGIGMAIEIVVALSAFDEYRFRTWLRTAANRTRPIPAGDAESIGRLTQERHWRTVANDLLQMMRSGRDDVKPALRACLPMIGRLDRWWYDLSPISTAEKWESIEELAAELYATGPDHDDLWERAGGHNSDLSQTPSGRARWREALGRIRRGGKGPQMTKLLREMRRDYPTNASLRFMSEDDEFKRPRR